MTTEIWRDFDPNLDLPEELKNARYLSLPDVDEDMVDDYDPYLETGSDDSDTVEARGVDEALGVPDSFSIISQTVRTAADGSQVIDIVLDLEEVPNAINYEVRVSPS
jgi:hypothetical protein